MTACPAQYALPPMVVMYCIISGYFYQQNDFQVIFQANIMAHNIPKICPKLGTIRSIRILHSNTLPTVQGTEQVATIGTHVNTEQQRSQAIIKQRSNYLVPCIVPSQPLETPQFLPVTLQSVTVIWKSTQQILPALHNKD